MERAGRVTWVGVILIIMGLVGRRLAMELRREGAHDEGTFLGGCTLFCFLLGLFLVLRGIL